MLTLSLFPTVNNTPNTTSRPVLGLREWGGVRFQNDGSHIVKNAYVPDFFTKNPQFLSYRKVTNIKVYLFI